MSAFHPLRTLPIAVVTAAMSSVRIVFFAASLLSACAVTDAARVSGSDAWHAEPPSQKLIDHIEDRLAEHSCVGNIERWARFYEWSQTKEGINSSVVEIDLRQAGVFGFTAGRRSRSRDPSLGPGEIIIQADDRNYRVAFGTYDVATEKLDLNFCGQNRN